MKKLNNGRRFVMRRPDVENDDLSTLVWSIYCARGNKSESTQRTFPIENDLHPNTFTRSTHKSVQPAMTPSTTWEFPPYTKTIHRSSYPAIDPKNPANSASGKVVVVTGGGGNIGKGISKAFIEAGAKAVAILGRHENLLKDAQAELKKTGSAKVLAIPTDVADTASLNAAFEVIETDVGKVDIAVSNAGYLPSMSPAASADIDDWWKGFEVNLKGILLVFPAWMEHQGSDTPTFISVNSGAAHVPAVPGASSYAASKIGAAHLVTGLQAENPDVRVVSMAPGVLESEMNTKSGMPTSHDDISLPSGFAVWLASQAASWTGGNLWWSHWDVEELEKMKDDTFAQGELTVGLKGWPKMVEPIIVP